MNLNLTLIGQIGTFLVLWWFTHKYIWPLFSKVAEARRQKIAEGLSMADKAKHSIADAQEESARLIAQAKTQATEIVGRAQKQARQFRAGKTQSARNPAQPDRGSGRSGRGKSHWPRSQGR